MTTKQNKHSWSIVAADRFIRATRDSGYKNTASAVSELVDNAIQARATSVQICIDKEEATKQIEVRVIDNGCGMDPFTLRQALRFGGSSRFNDRSGLGRFGMGLPNSSLSQAKRVTVTSWTNLTARNSSRRNVVGSGTPITTYIDADEIADGKMTEVPPPRTVCESPSHLTRSGTVVHWTNCDRLDFRRPSTISRHISQELSRRFRNFISQGVTISVNDNVLEPLDPLFLRFRKTRDRATPYGKEICYTISSNPDDDTAVTGTVRVCFSELPVKKWARLSNQEKRSRGIVSKAGVSIVRAQREVDYGWFFLGNKRKENYDEWWRCEVHFDPILDEAFGLTHTKQQIRPQQYLLEALCPDIEATARALNARARKAHAELKGSRGNKRSESIASDRSDFLEPVQGISATRLKTPYKIKVEPLDDGGFYAFRSQRGRFVLTLDPDHAFYRELYAPLSKSASNRDLQTLIELVLFSAARAEATMSSTDKERLHVFRGKWSNTLETLLGG